MAVVYRGAVKRLALLPGTRAQVAAAAETIATQARGDLAAHRVTGAATIDVTRAGPVDQLVSLVDPAALSIIFGRGGFTRPDGRYVGPMEPTNILIRSLRG